MNGVDGWQAESLTYQRFWRPIERNRLSEVSWWDPIAQKRISSVKLSGPFTEVLNYTNYRYQFVIVDQGDFG